MKMTCQELAAGTEEEKKGLSLERRNQKRFSSFPSLPPCLPPPQWGDGERPYLEGARVAGEGLAGRGSGPWGKRWEAPPRLGWGGGMTLDGKVPPSLLLEEARRRQMQVSLRVWGRSWGNRLWSFPAVLGFFSCAKRATHTPAFPRDRDLSPLDGICSAVSFFCLSSILFLNAEVCPGFVKPEVYSIWGQALEGEPVTLANFIKYENVKWFYGSS